MPLNYKHDFEVEDLGQFDLDQDRSIVSSIEYALKQEGIDAIVDGHDFSQSAFTVHSDLPRAKIEKALLEPEIPLADTEDHEWGYRMLHKMEYLR